MIPAAIYPRSMDARRGLDYFRLGDETSSSAVVDSCVWAKKFMCSLLPSPQTPHLACAVTRHRMSPMVQQVGGIPWTDDARQCGRFEHPFARRSRPEIAFQARQYVSGRSHRAHAEHPVSLRRYPGILAAEGREYRDNRDGLGTRAATGAVFSNLIPGLCTFSLRLVQLPHAVSAGW